MAEAVPNTVLTARKLKIEIELVQHHEKLNEIDTEAQRLQQLRQETVNAMFACRSKLEFLNDLIGEDGTELAD